jgi:hypothetical protein
LADGEGCGERQQTDANGAQEQEGLRKGGGSTERTPHFRLCRPPSCGPERSKISTAASKREAAGGGGEGAAVIGREKGRKRTVASTGVDEERTKEEEAER